MQKPDTPTGVPPSTDKERGTPTRIEERGGSLNPATQPKKEQPGGKGSVEKREQALDDALDDTFPGSDPVSTTPKVPDKPRK